MIAHAYSASVIGYHDGLKKASTRRMVSTCNVHRDFTANIRLYEYVVENVGDGDPVLKGLPAISRTEYRGDPIVEPSPEFYEVIRALDSYLNRGMSQPMSNGKYHRKIQDALDAYIDRRIALAFEKAGL